jgi:hypothetical protein
MIEPEEDRLQSEENRIAELIEIEKRKTLLPKRQEIIQ